MILFQNNVVANDGTDYYLMEDVVSLVSKVAVEVTLVRTTGPGLSLLLMTKILMMIWRQPDLYTLARKLKIVLPTRLW